MKKFILPLILILLLTLTIIGLTIDYTSQYPPAHNDTYVKATSTHSAAFFLPYYATDPALSVTGDDNLNSWLAYEFINTNQRFHIDLGSGKVIKRIYYENHHDTGVHSDRGANNFTFWGSNNAAAFAELTYGIDTNWTELTVAQNTFDEHIGADQADPKYIVVTNSTAYRYYAFKFADGHTDPEYIGVRRIELQTEDVVGITWNGITITKWNGVTITTPINTQ